MTSPHASSNGAMRRLLRRAWNVSTNELIWIGVVGLLSLVAPMTAAWVCPLTPSTDTLAVIGSVEGGQEREAALTYFGVMAERVRAEGGRLLIGTFDRTVPAIFDFREATGGFCGAEAGSGDLVEARRFAADALAEPVGDALEGIRATEDLWQRHGHRGTRLVVIAALTRVGGVDLLNADHVRSVREQLAVPAVWPNFSEAELYVWFVGAHLDPDQQESVEALWRDFVHRAGARVNQVELTPLGFP